MYFNVGDLQSRYSQVVRSFTDSFYSRLPVVVLARPERVISNMYSSQIQTINHCYWAINWMDRFRDIEILTISAKKQ
jgi:hypothetical protein